MEYLDLIKSGLEELNRITKTDFCLMDEQGQILADTFAGQEHHKAIRTKDICNFAKSVADSQNISGYNLLKVGKEMILLTKENGSDGYTIARIAASEINHILAALTEELTVDTFYQNLLLEKYDKDEIRQNIEALDLADDGLRVVYLIPVEKNVAEAGKVILSNLFAESEKDYVCIPQKGQLALIKSLKNKKEETKLSEYAGQIVSMLGSELMVNVQVSYGNPVNKLCEVLKSYKEAKIAMEVAKIFYDGRNIAAYSSLGIGRLIHELPVSLCETFLDEVFGNKKILQLTEDELSTIDKFFENNLNISETARELFMHRNTLVYHFEKLQKTTGLDIRRFDDALTFKIATMVARYMRYLQST
ncbi:MAG: PucR family transcriptional regulator [Lachnospiraceae bacterium]